MKGMFEKCLTKDALDLILTSRTYMFGWVIVARHLHFHIYYLFVVPDVIRQMKIIIAASMALCHILK
jgi:hypothetical protein